MILISMQGADGSSSAFVNNIHIVCKAKENEVKRPRLLEGHFQASVSFLL